MRSRVGFRIVMVAFMLFLNASNVFAQQKGQYVPGQYGLNAGALPDPGFTYLNETFDYSASQLNNANGNVVPGITGTYSFWAIENFFYYVPKRKVLGGYYIPYFVLPLANGSLVADLGNPPTFRIKSSAVGVADMYFQPVNFGWHVKQRVDVQAGYGFTAPTGRFTPGGTNNVGSGYWGNDITTNSTFYLTKDQGTQADLATTWEIHGQKSGTNITPGQAFTLEWGLGQIIPLKKDQSQLFQGGVVGYDQWQVSCNSGITKIFPYYSVQGIGLQTNYLLPAKGLAFFFKYYWEYAALARPQGRTIMFGGTYTFRIPKPNP